MGIEELETIHDVTEMLKEQDKQVYSTEIVLWYKLEGFEVFNG